MTFMDCHDRVMTNVTSNAVVDAIDNVNNSFWSMFERKATRGAEIEPVPSEDAYSFPECNYDRNPTNLYKQLENKNWQSVNHFLLTGYWSGSLFADSKPPSEQACTWVTRYDPNSKRKKVIWTHLPIHAALSFGAPEGVIQLLVKIAPPTLRCADDQRMLPLHLAFRRGASDATVSIIMDAFPEGVSVRDYMGRTPSDCAAEGPNPKRGAIIQTVLHYNQRTWEKKVNKAHEKQVNKMRTSLQQRAERIDNLQTAFGLMKIRDDQTRDSFSRVMGQLNKLKIWHDENKPEQDDGDEDIDDDRSMTATFVKEFSQKLMDLHGTAKELYVQHRKSKKDTDRTLKNLEADWDNGFVDDVKLRSFAETKTDGENESDASSKTSLITSSTNNREKVKAESQTMETAEEAEEPAEAPKEEEAVEASPEGSPHEVPNEVLSGDEEEIKHAVSDMTSVDMGSIAESRVSKSSKASSFRKGLKKIAGRGSKKQDSPKKPMDDALPPKNAAKQTKTKRPGILKGGSVKVSPTL